MAQDFFGTERTFKSKAEIVTSEFAALSIDGRVGLVQSVQGNYQRDIRQVMEAGSSTIFFTFGPATGDLTVNKMVGKAGFFAALSKGLANCGIIQSASVNLLPGNKCSVVSAQAGLKFGQTIIRGVNFSYATGPEPVTEGVSMLITDLDTFGG